MADMPTIHHVVAHAAVLKPIIFHGVTYMTALISSAVAAGIGFGLGWYIKGRGMAGVKIDISNIKNDIVALKTKVDPSAPIAPVTTFTA